MIYTKQRRMAMNKAVRAMYPELKFYENVNSVPVMECDKLPNGAKQVIYPEDLFARVNSHCVKTNNMGLSIPDYRKAFPVFIHSMEINGKETRFYYRVNYVSVSEGSQQKAAEYIAEGKLYAVLK